MPGAPWPPTTLPSSPTTKTPTAVTFPSTRAAPSTDLRSSSHRGRDGLGGGRAVQGGAAHGADHDVPDGGGEQRGEAAAQGVGEDQRAGDERDPEHDRERAQQQAHLAPEQALEGDLEHQAARLAGRGHPGHDVEHALAGGVAHLLDDACRRRGRRTRSVYAAATGSWVTITIVWPKSSTLRRSSSSTSAPEWESRLPVGSSAKTIRGRLTSARATATRCCWPPESSLGLWSSRSARLDRVDDAAVPLGVGLAAGDRQRQQDVLLRGQRRHQVVGLEDEADLVAAQLGERLVLQARSGSARR